MSVMEPAFEQEMRRRERIEQELRIARLIQQTLLPKTLPQLTGYDIAAYYQPAREVGGDFYDFLELEDGRLGLVVGRSPTRVFLQHWLWPQRALCCARPPSASSRRGRS